GAGGEQLRVVLADGGAHHHGRRALDRLGGVAHAHVRTQAGEPLERGGVLGVGPADGVAAREEQLGDDRHAGATDPDEVDPLGHRPSPIARATRSASRAAPSRTPAPAARSPMPASRPGSASSGTTVATTHAGVRSSSATSSPPPASTTPAALSRCSPLPIGSGTYTAGMPSAASSHTVPAPARPTTRSAHA